MPVTDLHDALREELRDMLSAEKQIAKALRKFARRAFNPQLRRGFEQHLQQTEGQIKRLEQAFEVLEFKPRSKQCVGMAGILEEGEQVLDEAADPNAMDAMLIAAAQKVEHYEIASYGAICTWAKTLGFDQVAKSLHQSLEEEKHADAKLTKLAEKINKHAQPA